MTNLPLLFLVSTLASLGLVWGAMHFIRRKEAHYDMPDDPAGRFIPVPRVGGLAVMPVIFAGMTWLYSEQMLLFPQPLCWLIVLASGFAMTLISWANDKRKDRLAAFYRFTIQIMAVIIPLWMLPSEWRICAEYLPFHVERILIGAGWLLFTNIYNFMDGINGITGTQTISITGGIVVLTLISGMGLENGLLEMNIITAGAAAGFMFWNCRPKARVFLSDLGSLGLGYQLGWMLLLISIQGYAVVALILPMVYLMDATFTVVRRAVQGKRIWKNHRDHLYQRVTHETGVTHMQATLMIAVTNVLLLFVAMAVVQNMLTPLYGFVIAAAIACFLMGIFYKIGKRAL